MEYGTFKLTDEAKKQLQQQGEAAAARGARANAAVETKKGNTDEAARWTAKADEIEQKITKNRGYTITGNEAIDVRNELRIRAGLAPSTDITPQWRTINDTNKAYTNYLDDLDKQEKQLQYQITKLKRKEQTAAEDTGDPDVVYDATHNDTIRTLNNQLDRIRAQKSFTSENQTVFNVSVRGDTKLFDEYRDLYYQEQGNRLASWASAFTGADGSNNAARNAQTQQRLNELRVELKKKGYTDEDIQAYINVANTKENQEYVQAAQEWANKNILTQNIATAGSILTAPIRGAMGAIGIALDPGTKNSPYSYLSNVAHGVQETVGEDIKNDIVRSVKRFLPDGKTADKAADYIGTAGSWVYQAAVSSLESALNMGIGGHLGEVLMGLDAATSTYNEALNNGLSADKALGSALAAGAFETIFEHMSMENIRAFKNAAASSNIFKSMASLMFTEGSEEFFTDIANEIYDYMANGGLSAYERFKEEYIKNNPKATEKDAQKAYAIQFGKQLGQSFVVGALSGGMHGGAMIAGRGVNTAVNTFTGNYNTGAQVRSTAANQGVSAAEVAKGLTEQVQEGGKAAKALGKLSTETETKQNALQKLASAGTTMRTGKAVNAALKEISDTQKSVVIEALQEDGKLSKTAATELLDSYNRIQNMTATEDDVVRVTDNSELLESTLEGLTGNTEYKTRQEAVEEFRNTLLKNITKTNTERALKAGRKVFGERKIKDAKAAAKRSDAVKEAIKTGTTEELNVPTYAATATDAGNVQLGAIKSVEEGKVQVIADESGATVDLNDVTFAETTDGEKAATIYNTLRDMMTGAGEYRTVMSVEGANAALAMLQGSTLDAGTFLRQFYDAYQAGTVGRNIDTFMFDTDYDLSNEEMAAAYSAGAKEYNVKPGITRIGTQELTGRQKKEVEVLEPMLEKLGVKLILVDSLVSKSGEVWGEAYGATEGDVIVLALESIGRENLISVTGYHELFHWMGKVDPQGQKALIKSVIETLKKTDGVDYKAIYDQKAKVYKNASEAKIEEEIACQYLGTILASNQARIAAAKGNTGLWQKALAHLKEWFSNIKQEIKTKFASDMAVQAALMQDAETAEKQVDAFLEMLEGIQSGEKRAESGEKRAENGDTENSFAGVLSETADKSLLRQAQEMEEDGATSEEIRQATGWFRGYDGKWRYEIDDSKIQIDVNGRFLSNPDLRRYKELEYKFIHNGTMTSEEEKELRTLQQTLEGVNKNIRFLEDIIKSDNLFEAYPWLRRGILVSFTDLPKNTGGRYLPGKGIEINRDMFALLSAKNRIEALRDSEAYKEVTKKLENIESQKEKAYDPLLDQYAAMMDTADQAELDALDEKINAVADEYDQKKQRIWDEFKNENETGKELYALQEKYSNRDLKQAEEKIKKDLLHEIQHVIQVYEGFARGASISHWEMRGSDNPRRDYFNTAGEVEARDTAARYDLTTEERKKFRPDIDRTDVVFADGGTANSEGLTGGVKTSWSLVDDEYMDAVEAGDEAKQQELVEQAAKNNGYKRRVYHGTKQYGFTVFDPNLAEDKISIFASSTIDAAASYADNYDTRRRLGDTNYVRDLYYLDGMNYKMSIQEYNQTYGEPKGGVYELYLNDHGFLYLNFGDEIEEDIYDPAYWNKLPTERYPDLKVWANGADYVTTKEVAKYAHDNKYNGVIMDHVVNYGGATTSYTAETNNEDESEIIVAFDPTAMKSADPVTYDDNGNVIPLSERFNSENNDIRYSLVEDAEAEAKMAELRGQNEQLQEELQNLNAMFDAYKRVARQREGKVPSKQKMMDILKKYMLNDPKSKEHRTEMAENIISLLNRVMDGSITFNSFSYTVWDMMVDEVQHAGHWENIGDNSAFKKEFRDDGKMAQVYLDQAEYDKVAKQYGGRSQFRKAMFGKLNVTTDKNAGARSLQDFYEGLVKKGYGLEETDAPLTMIENMMAKYKEETRLWTDDDVPGNLGKSAGEIAEDMSMQLLTDILSNANVLNGIDTELYTERIAELQAEVQNARQRRIEKALDNARKEARQQTAQLEADETLTSSEIDEKSREIELKLIRENLARDYQERMRAYEKQSRRAYQTEQERKDIRRRVRKLSDMLIKNTKTKNVPQPMKKYVKDIIMDHMNDDGIFSKKEIETLRIDLARLKTPNVNGPTFDFTRFSEALRDQYLEMKNDMTRGGQMYGVGMRLADMTPTQVDIMNAFTENVLHVVEHAGETFLEHRNGNIMQDGESVIKNLRKVFEGMSEKEKKRTRGLINSMMKNDYMTSFYFFKEHMGGMIGDYFDMITLAESNEGIRLREIEDFFSNLKEKYDYDKNKWGKESHLLHLPTYESRIDENGELPVVSIKNWDVDLSTEACMQVYAWYRREVMSGQQSSHLVPYINKDGDVFGGGVVLSNDLQKAQSKLSQAADDFKAGFKASKDRAKGTEEYIAFLKEKENEINVAADKNRHLLTEGAVEAIIESLTEEQKKYVEEVTDFLSHTCGEWGNDATMKWYGVRFFEEDYYFPYETPSEFSSRRYGLTNEKRLGSWGPTHRTNVYAHTPLVLSSFTETASRHAYEMATYSEFLVPIEQMTSLLSYSNLEGEDASVQSMVKSVYGDRALSYISNFMTQLNGGVKGDEVDSLVNRLTGRFKAGAVMANFSVVIQQPSASLRAMAMIDPKYFFKRNGLRKADYEEMVRHSGVAVIKEIGGFDTDIGSNIAKTLSGQKSKMDKVNDLMGWGAEKADALTWTWIWNACKYEVADLGKEYVYDKNNQRHRWIAQTFIAENIKEGTAEFDEAIKQELFLDDVRARFEDVVHRTQVYDSVISKNRWMRSETGLLKMLTAFMAEPTMSLNMLMMSGKGKIIAKKTAIAAFVGNIIVNSALRSIVSMWRHRDEDETYFESWVEEFVKDLIGDRHVLFLDGAWSPLGMIPLIKDVISLLQGYDVERSDISVAGDVVEDVKDILNAIKGNDKDITTWGVPDMELMMNLGFDVSKMFGVPTGNVYRDGSSIARWFDYLINDPKWGYSLSAFKEAIERGLSVDQSDEYRAFMSVLNNDEELIKRMTAADREAVDKLMAKGYDEDEAIAQAEINARDNFDTKCADGIVRYDPEKRAQEAAECLNSGTLAGLRRHDELRQEMIDDGFSNNAVQRAIDQCYKALQPAEDKDVKEKKQLDAYSYDILDNAMDANDKAAYQHVREKLMEQGKSEDTINDHVTKRITELFRDNEITMDTAITMYKEYAGKTKAKAEDKAKDIITDMMKDGILTADKAKDMYTKYAGLDADKAAANADYNKYIMDHPNTNMDSTKWGAYTKIISGVGKSARDCGIDAEVFATYKDKAAECHADVDKNGETISGSKRAKVLKVIDELPITKEQKDALYYLNDYAPSTLRDTPWHK